jgi:tRNA pseudouridine55 synthase
MTQFRHPPRRAVSGVLLLDKPQGLSSNTALQIARRLFNAEKAGHTGTLDPMATGLLPLCFGEATKFSQSLLDADKGYDAAVCLGVTTDSDDAEGRVLERRPVAVSRQDVEPVLASLTGDIEQIPPMYSALKRDGKPLYELARQGIEVERASRRVCIHGIELLAFDGERLEIRVSCSKGTYIRTLARDIGERLGCGAHLCALRRTATGGLSLEGAVTLEALEAHPPADRDRLLLPPDLLLASLPPMEVPADELARFLNGQPVRLAASGSGARRVYAASRFLGLAELDTDGWLRPKRLVVPD